MLLSGLIVLALVVALVLSWPRLVAGKPPAVRVGRAWQPGGTLRKQLREDANARFFPDRGGILLRKRMWFVASGTPPFEIARERHMALRAGQLDEPQHVVDFNTRSYWWYRDVIYWTNADYTGADVKAILFTRERQQQRQLEHAHAVLATADTPTSRRREPIPREVKLAVWERDGGRCVECGSDFDLQYDHDIPLSMGGATTVDNLQLLCARCNQRKGGRL